MSNGWMPRAARGWWGRMCVFVPVAVLGLAAVPPSAAQQNGSERRTVWDRVFTDVQADRGERTYGRSCSHCHGLSLEGDSAREVPSLASDTFVRRWRGRTVQALFDSLVRSMPADDVGSLTPRMTADLIAYLLRAGGASPGEEPLPAERDALAGVVIEEKP
jgi:hypothetical protein